MADLFRTRDHVADFDTYASRYAGRSAATRATLRSRLEVSYGDGPEEKLDLFFPANTVGGAPVHLFVHGGYWRMFSKDDFSFVADTVIAAGGIAAIMDYALMPGVRMATIVDQVRRAALWLRDHAADFAGDGTRLSISGHSAGAHLCALLLRQPSSSQPISSLLLSGVYELEPLRHSFLQPLIQLTDQEVEQYSPLRLPLQPAGAVRVLVGEHETAPFHTQAEDFARKLGTGAQTIIGGNHMSVALDLGDRGTDAGKALAAICS